MNDAILYANANSFQRVSTKKVLDEYVHKLQWQKDDSVLDIGCGTGDTTIDLILPLLPSTFSRLLGCDKSDKMIQYARLHFGRTPKVIFEQLDITENVDEFRTKFGTFDHAVSFFCLHWVQNQKAAMKNIAKLLTPTGDCLLLIITSSNIFTVYYEMSKSSKWSPYMKDVEEFTPPYYDSICPTDDLSEIMHAVGFHTCEIRARDFKHMYSDYDEFINFIRSINPFVHRLIASEREDFINEVAASVMVKNMESNGNEYLQSIDVVVVNAKK